MNDEIKKLSQELAAITVRIAKLADNPASNDQYFTLAEELLAKRQYLMSWLVDAEVAYQRVIKKSREAGLSVSASENEGKSSDEYAVYKKAKLIYDDSLEQIMLVKKMMGMSDSEYKSS